MPFLASDLNHIIKHLLYLVMKRDIVDGISSAILSEPSLSNITPMKKTANIEIRFTADAEFKLLQRSSKSKVTDRAAQTAYRVSSIVNDTMLKAPTKYSIVRNKSCIDPRTMAVTAVSQSSRK